MHEFLEAAERLRIVKRARGEFLERWIVENLVIGPMLLDRLARAVARYGAATTPRLQPPPPWDEES